MQLSDLDLKSALGLGGEPAIFHLNIWIGLEFEVFYLQSPYFKKPNVTPGFESNPFPWGTLKLALDLIGAPDWT